MKRESIISPGSSTVLLNTTCLEDILGRLKAYEEEYLKKKRLKKIRESSCMPILKINQIAINKTKETAQTRTVETSNAAIIMITTQSHIEVEAVATIEEEDSGATVREMHQASRVSVA